MRHGSRYWPVAACVFWMLAAAPSFAQPLPPFVEGEIIVKFRAGADAATIAGIAQREGLVLLRNLRGVGATLLRLPASGDPERVAARLRALPSVEYAEPNYLYAPNLFPNDPRFSDLYGLDNVGQTGGTADADIDAPEAWDIVTGAPGVVVAVIDTGADIGHADLAANIWTNAGEIAGNGIDDDGNGFVDDVVGWDFRDNDNDPADPSPACSGHGTHVAGTIGAVGNNGVGVTGVAHTVEIMVLRALGGLLCSGSNANLAEAIAYAGANGARIVNASWGGTASSATLQDAIRQARLLFVAAAGNSGQNTDTNPHYPSAYNLSSIVAVAATNDQDVLAGFSNYGTTTVDLAAPGVSILSTVPGNAYAYLSGTSMASPHVAGAAALLLGDDPSLTVSELKYKLLTGVDPRGLPVASGGRLNIFESLSLSSVVTAAVVANGPTIVSAGDRVRFARSYTNTSAVPQTVEVSLREWMPAGGETTVVSPTVITLQAGATASFNFVKRVTRRTSLGEHRFISTVKNSAGVFDEAQIDFDVVP